MRTIDMNRITPAVISLLRVNMGLKPGERVLVVADYPTGMEWKEKVAADLEVMLARNLLAKKVSELARDHFPGCPVEFYAYPATGGHGVEPDEQTGDKMLQADVIIAITNYSLSHTKARGTACRAGARVASMPLFLPEMFLPGGPMDVDYLQVAEDTQKIARRMTEAQMVTIKTGSGTNLTLNIAGRTGREDNGLYTSPGLWGNLPAGEAYTAPVEGIGEGQLVVQAGWYRRLKENMTLYFKDGRVTAVEGGGEVGKEMIRLLGPKQEPEKFRTRRCLAEFAVGTNPHARRKDNVLEAEKIKGTVHVAIGDSSQIGGTITSDFHEDFVIPKPDVYFDGEPVIRAGEWAF